MAIEQVTENIFYVSLPKTQHINRELEPLNDLMVTGNSYDIILDFLLIDMVTSASISTLLILHDILQTHGRRVNSLQCFVRDKMRTDYDRLK